MKRKTFWSICKAVCVEKERAKQLPHLFPKKHLSPEVFIFTYSICFSYQILDINIRYLEVLADSIDIRITSCLVFSNFFQIWNIYRTFIEKIRTFFKISLAAMCWTMSGPPITRKLTLLVDKIKSTSWNIR